MKLPSTVMKQWYLPYHLPACAAQGSRSASGHPILADGRQRSHLGALQAAPKDVHNGFTCNHHDRLDNGRYGDEIGKHLTGETRRFFLTATVKRTKSYDELSSTVQVSIV